MKISNNSPTRQEVPEKVQEVGDNFESLFVNMMIEKMREAGELSDEDQIIPKTNGERIYQSMLDAEYAKLGAKNGDLGISKVVVEQLMRDQGSKK